MQTKKAKRRPIGYWTEAKVRKEAKKYKTRFEFMKACGGAHNHATVNGYIYDLFPASTVTKKPTKKVRHTPWTYDECNAEAAKYTTRGKFSIESNGAYMKAQKMGWLDEFFPVQAHAYITKDSRGFVEMWSEKPKYDSEYWWAKDDKENGTLMPEDMFGDLLCEGQCITVTVNKQKVVTDYATTPEGKIMNAIFGKRK